MPSEIMDFSQSSFFPEEVNLPSERQVGFWKSETMPEHYGSKLDGMLRPTNGNLISSSPLEKQIPVGPHMMKRFDIPNDHLIRDSLKPHPGTRSSFSTESASYFMEGSKNQVMGSQFENGLFSSSVSELFSRKLKLSSNNAVYGHSAGAAASHYEEEEPFESLEEMEAQTIGNLLPNDDDLFSGVTDGLEYITQPSSGDDVEDFDVFSSGGMELGEDGYPSKQRGSEVLGGNSNGLLGGSTGSDGELPSRTLFVRNINSNIEDSELQILFEQYGDIRTLYTSSKHRGFVMISYYDIRAAWNAMKALQNKPLRRRKLDIHFSIPKDNPTEKDINQGTLVVSNLDASVPNDELRQIFGVYGEIKEIRESPNRRRQKLIEFYDIRAADAALQALNRSDIGGKPIKLESSHPGGARRSIQSFSEMDQDDCASYLQRSSYTNLTSGFSGSISQGYITSSGIDNKAILGAIGSPISPFLDNTFHQGISSSVPKSIPSIVRVESIGNQYSVPEIAHSPGQMKFELRGPPNFHPHSLPDYHDGLAHAVIGARQSERIENRQFSRVGSNGHSVELHEGVFGPSGNGSCPPPAHQYMWGNMHRPQPQSVMWPNSPSFVNGICTPHPPPRLPPPSHMMNTLLSMNNHHVGSAPSVNSLWDRRQSYGGESPDASFFHAGSLGNMRIPGNPTHPMDFLSHNGFPRVGMDLPVPSKNAGMHMMFPNRGQMVPMVNSFDSPNERARSRRNEGNSNQGDNKKQFELDIDRILQGDDERTTLMLKNIPNKYTSKMLLASIDERHRGTYDFIYLPIDFKNKCNVGYAFINMTEPSLIVPFYQAFNGKKWEKFNSEKVASIAYARIQGKNALIAHFQNSSLMNEDKRCRPLLFDTDGPNAGDQVPFPMGANVRSRPNKNRGIMSDENHLKSPLDLPNGEEYSNGDPYSGSAKDSD